MEEGKQLTPVNDSSIATTRIATTLHTLLCKSSHSSACLWYLENQQAECWELKAHAHWLNKAEGVVQLSELTEEQIELLLKELTKVISSIQNIQYRFYQVENFINVVIKETCLKVE